MKDLKLKDLKPITKVDQMLKELLDEEIYSDSLDEKNADAKEMEEYAQDN